MSEHLSRVDRYKEERKKKRKTGQRTAKSYSTNSELSVLRDAESTEETFIENVTLEPMSEEKINTEDLPTRKELFPSQRLKMTKLFYNSLLYIFIVIMGLLLWWAVKDSPWGEIQGF